MNGRRHALQTDPASWHAAALAAGLGRRLRPATCTIPRPLVPIRGGRIVAAAPAAFAGAGKALGDRVAATLAGGRFDVHA